MNSTDQMTTAAFRNPPLMQPSPDEVAAWVGGELKDGAGAPARITAMATLDLATADEMSFVADRKRIEPARESKAGLLIAPKGIELGGVARIEVDQVWPAVAAVLNRLYPVQRPAAGVHPMAVVEPGASFGEGVSVGPGCWIGAGARVGARTVLGPNCVIGGESVVGEDCVFASGVSLHGRVSVGSRVVLHAGVALGADGFRFEPTPKGLLKIPQVGVVIIEDDVEIGANTTIDRAFLHETRVGRGTKIDNLVQIGHNVRIGANCVIAGCAGIAGSVTIEDNCMIGGAAMFRDGITIGKGAMIGGATAVDKDVPPGQIVLGIPARPHRDFFRTVSLTQQLPELFQRVKALEQAGKES